MTRDFLTLLAVILLLGFTSCGGDDDDEVVQTEKQTGYVVQTQSGVGQDISNFIQFFDDIPSGSIDNTQGKSFQQFNVSSKASNFIVSRNISGGDEGYSQVKFNLEGEAFESEFLPTLAFAGFVGMQNSETGFYGDGSTENINIFNPTTMQNTGVIDMTSAYRVPNWTSVTWETYVVRGNDLFVWTRPAIAGSGSFYASDSAIVNHIDLASGTYQSTSFFADKGLSRRTTENWVDGQGNIYFSVGGAGGVGGTPAILKIPAGATSFDPGYNFDYTAPVSSSLGILPVLAGNFEYHQNGKGYTVVSTTVPQELTDFLNANGGLAAILADPDLLNQALALLNASANGQFIELDLVAQTATVIPTLPTVSASASGVTIIDGKVYCIATSGGINAVYQYNPDTGAATEVFNVTAGGRILGFYKIGE
ncbi:MAG: hypothetical protein AAGI38_12815 [Bacteroidota bacterium]